MRPGEWRTIMFDWTKPTTQMLGRWQPWHKGHTELFKRALAETGQVCIMIREVGGIVGEDVSAGRTVIQDDNPFVSGQVAEMIQTSLELEGYKYNEQYVIMRVPNIVDISYGRGVGYTFTEHDLGKDIHEISATKIRKEIYLIPCIDFLINGCNKRETTPRPIGIIVNIKKKPDKLYSCVILSISPPI